MTGGRGRCTACYGQGHHPPDNPNDPTEDPTCVKCEGKGVTSPRTTTKTQWSVTGRRYRAKCICGRQMLFFMDRLNLDAWVRNHESGNWCNNG